MIETKDSKEYKKRMYLRKEEVADILGISQSKLASARKTKLIPFFAFNSRDFLYKTRDIFKLKNNSELLSAIKNIGTTTHVNLPKRIKIFLYFRDKGLCQICKQPAKFNSSDIDHVKPIKLGGTDDISNLQITHPICNRRKGAR